MKPSKGQQNHANPDVHLMTMSTPSIDNEKRFDETKQLCVAYWYVRETSEYDQVNMKEHVVEKGPFSFKCLRNFVDIPQYSLVDVQACRYEERQESP